MAIIHLKRPEKNDQRQRKLRANLLKKKKTSYFTNLNETFVTDITNSGNLEAFFFC